MLSQSSKDSHSRGLTTDRHDSIDFGYRDSTRKLNDYALFRFAAMQRLDGSGDDLTPSVRGSRVSRKRGSAGGKRKKWCEAEPPFLELIDTDSSINKNQGDTDGKRQR